MAATTEKTPLLEEERGVFGALGSQLLRSGVDLKKNLGESYNQGCSSYDKLFLKNINRDFGDHLEVASRGACFVVVCALPFVLPAEICQVCQDVVRLEIYTAASITYFIYTLYVYTGDILHFAQGGVFGTFLAVLSIWLMQGFMPGGYSLEEPHRWEIGVVWGIVFVFLILYLNFDDNTRIFALSTYVWYWMAFLIPDYQAGFAQNFQIKLSGKAIRELLVAAAGCGIAVIAGYFPYPIYAHKKALNLSRSMMEQIFMAKSDFLDYYCSSKEADRLKVKILSREMDTLRGETGAVGSLLDSSWYEAVFLKSWQKQREMMFEFQVFISKTIDLLSNASAVGLDEDFSPDHQKLMKVLQNELEEVLENNGKVLLTCVAILNMADSPKELVDYGQGYLDKSKAAMKRLTKEFIKNRASDGMNKVGEDTAGENVVALTFCQFTQLTEDFFGKLQKDSQVDESRFSIGSILSIFSPALLKDKDHIMWTIRNALSIILAFFVGWHGYNKYISSYNASLASTVAVLLSKFAGSAMTKNLARLQGVVIGIVLGNLLYALLAWCFWWGHLLVAIALYLWTLMGLFMYFHSENYSTVGLLLVVFGAQALLRPCSNSDTDPSGHSLIVNVTVAICIMTIVDLCLSRTRASDMAIKAFEDTMMKQQHNMQMLFSSDKNDEKVEQRKGGVAGGIDLAASLGNEAYMEPRYWRLEWPESVYNQGIACLTAVRFKMMAIESAVLFPPDKDSMQQKSDVFLTALKCKNFTEKGGLRDILMIRYGGTMKAFKEMLQDDAYKTSDVFAGRLESLDHMKELESTKWQEKYEAFTKELQEEYRKRKPRTDLEDLRPDDLAQLSVFIESLKAMFVELDKVLDAVVA
jgi:hypothetical protein